jgi:hypothetical protein
MSESEIPRAPRVFLSYASEDVNWIQQFKRWFVMPLGNVVLVDFKDGKNLGFGPLGPWLDQRLDEAAVMVAFVSRNYPQKAWTQAEWRKGLTKTHLGQLIFVPVMMDAGAKLWWAQLRKQGELAALPPDYQFFDFTNEEGRPAPIGDSGPIVNQISALAQEIRIMLGEATPRSKPPSAPTIAGNELDTQKSQASYAPAIAGNELDTQKTWTFVSFSQHDKRAAMEIIHELERAKIGCWISTRDVPYGKDYQEAIVDAIDQADSMVLVFSNHANDSAEVARELALASERKILILPLRIEDAKPTKALRYQLATRQYVDLYENREQKMKLIIQGLHKIRGIRRSGLN